MDGAVFLLYYPNMDIPTYGLYGEALSLKRYDWLHWETIQARSRLHDYRIAPHRHEQFFQILYLDQGLAQVMLDDVTYELSPPAIAVVPALSVHGYAFSRDVDGLVVTMMERDLAQLGLPLPEAAILRNGFEHVVAVLRDLIAEVDRPEGGHDLAMRAILTLLLVALHRAGEQMFPACAGIEPGRQHAQKFRLLVDRWFRRTRRVADYAREIGISQTHLNRVCRQVLGGSALELIERRIALEARRQLRFSTLSIKEIGAGLGYEDPAYFTRFMTRTLGETPGSLRKRAQAL